MTINFNSSGMDIQYNKYVQINKADALPEKYLSQISEASETLGNYAKNKKVTINLIGCEGYRDEPAGVGISVNKKGVEDAPSKFVTCKEKDTKPFLRRVYERVQLLTEGTEPRINKMQQETISKLKKIGKIK